MSSFSPMLAALFISLFLLLETATTTVAQGVNITEMLSSSSFGGQFTTFNDYLTKSGVADKISKMHAATVLVVANANASGLASLPAGAMEHTMEAHVIDDFYDADRLEETRQGEPLATLYQRTGHAIDREGFLFVTPPYKGTAMTFASASTRGSGSPARPSILAAQLTKQPGHFSLLQITNFIQIPSLAPANASAPTASTAAGNSSSSSSNSSSSSSPTPAHGSGPAASPPKSNSTSPASSPPSHTPSHAPASSPPASSSSNSSTTPAPPPRPARAPAASPPQQNQPAAPPRKMLAPAPSTKPGGKAPTPSTSAAPTAATTPAAADGPGSSSVTPPAAADVPASASPTDAKSSGVSSGNHVQAIVMIFVASAWFLLAMI